MVTVQIATVVLYALAVCFYACAAALYIYQAVRHDDRYRKAGHVFLIGGIVFHSITIGMFSVMTKGTVLGGANILMLSAWAFIVIYGIFEMRLKSQSYGVFAIPVVAIAMVIAGIIGFSADNSIPVEVYESWPFLACHVGAFIAAAAFFFISGIASIMILWQGYRLKKHPTEVLSSKIPSMSALKRIARRSVLIGLPIYTLGLILGVAHGVAAGSLVTASTTGVIMFLSVRIVFSSAVWLFYIFYLIAVYLISLSSKTISILSIIGAVAVFAVAYMSSTLPMLNG